MTKSTMVYNLAKYWIPNRPEQENWVTEKKYYKWPNAETCCKPVNISKYRSHKRDGSETPTSV